VAGRNLYNFVKEIAVYLAPLIEDMPEKSVSSLVKAIRGSEKEFVE
jgi:hypothetical protein